MKQLSIALTIRLETALSIGAGGSAGTLADKSIVRDGWGRPIIPGSQLKGKLRWAVEQLLRSMGEAIPTPFDQDIEKQTLVRAIFGSPDQRSPLRFADLPITIMSPEQALNRYQELSSLRPSVAINRRRGVAEDARLLILELAHEGFIFQDDKAITGFLDDTIAEQSAALLWAALKLTDRWGGAKSRGLGWASATAHFLLDGQALHDDLLADALRVALKGAA